MWRCAWRLAGPEHLLSLTVTAMMDWTSPRWPSLFGARFFTLMTYFTFLAVPSSPPRRAEVHPLSLCLSHPFSPRKLAATEIFSNQVTFPSKTIIFELAFSAVCPNYRSFSLSAFHFSCGFALDADPIEVQPYFTQWNTLKTWTHQIFPLEFFSFKYLFFFSTFPLFSQI